MKKIKYEYGDKKKLTEVKKKFKIDQFIKILNSKENPSIFSTLEEITKVDICVEDEFTREIGLVKFFKKISNQLTYAPIISLVLENDAGLGLLDFGLLKCVLKNNDFQIYLIKSDVLYRTIAQGDVESKNYFKLNKETEDMELLNILYAEINQKEPYAEHVYFFADLPWSKVLLRTFIKTIDKKIVFHDDNLSIS